MKAIDKVIAKLKEHGFEYSLTTAPVWQSLKAVGGTKFGLKEDVDFNWSSDRAIIISTLKGMQVEYDWTRSNFKGYTCWIKVDGQRLVIPAISRAVEFSIGGQYLRSTWSENQFFPRGYRSSHTTITDIMSLLDAKSPTRIKENNKRYLERLQKDLISAQEEIANYETQMSDLKSRLANIISPATSLSVEEKVDTVLKLMAVDIPVPDKNKVYDIQEEIQKLI